MTEGNKLIAPLLQRKNLLLKDLDKLQVEIDRINELLALWNIKSAGELSTTMQIILPPLDIEE